MMSLLSALVSFLVTLTSRLQASHQLTTLQDGTGSPPVRLYSPCRRSGFLLEPRPLAGSPSPKQGDFGDKFYIIDKDERLEYGPGEKGEHFSQTRFRA